MTHLLLVGPWPELASRLIGLPGRVTILQLDSMPGGSDLAPLRGWAAELVRVPWGDPAAALRAAAEVHTRVPLDVVAGFGEFALDAVLTIADGLGIRSVPGPADRRTGKAVQRELLTAGGCRPVRYRACADPGQAAEFRAQVAGPVVLKPDRGNGSLGVSVVDRVDELEAAWSWVTRAGLGGVLAEELLTGPEFSAETRSVGGRHEVLMLTEKLNSGPPHFVETGHLMPARIGAAAWGVLENEAVQALTALGHRDGPAHVEVMLTPDGPAVVEVNLRPGGDRIWELLQLSTGLDLLRLMLLDALAVPSAPVRSGGVGAACIRFLHGATEQFADGLPQPPAAPVPAPAELVRFRWEPTSYHRRLGHVLTAAGEPDRALAAADRVSAVFPAVPPAGTVEH